MDQQSNHYQIPIPKIRSYIESLGIKKGDTLLVHSSIEKFFHGSSTKENPKYSNVIEYSKAMIQMMTDLLGKEGTLIFPTDSISISLSEWSLKKKLFNYISGGTLTPYFMINKTYIDENKKVHIEYFPLDGLYKKEYRNFLKEYDAYKKTYNQKKPINRRWYFIA